MRSLLIDDSAHFLTAARGLLEREGVDVVGLASTSADAIRMTRELRPDVVLVDIDLGEESGFDLAERLTSDVAEDCAVVLISAYPERDFAELIAESPALGFVPKAEISAARIGELVGAGGDHDGRAGG